MNRSALITFSVLAAFAAAGCSTTQITDSHNNIGNQRLARPGNIIVVNFAATPDEIAAAAPEVMQQDHGAVEQTEADIEAGRQLGASVASELVSQIRDMGMNASGPQGVFPRPGDLVIKGYFDSVDTGSATKRVMLGFGSGAAHLRTVVVAYQMTPSGLRRLGSGSVESGGNKTPGLLVPLAVVAATANPVGLVVGGAVKATGEATGNDTITGAGKRTAKAIAERLEERFKEQGWIE